MIDKFKTWLSGGNRENEILDSLKAVHANLKSLDPFYFAQKGKTDEDSITNLYLSLSKSQPELSNLLKSVSQVFRQFEDSIKELLTDVQLINRYSYTENQELVARLNVGQFNTIKRLVENINKAFENTKNHYFSKKDIDKKFRTVKQLWHRFYFSWSRIIPELEKGLSKKYTNVQGDRWDKTKTDLNPEQIKRPLSNNFRPDDETIS